jgi:predicted dehydrogenase
MEAMSANAKSAPSPLRVGIIGCGVIAPAHIESYQLAGGVEVAWACDLVEEKAARLAGKYAVPFVTTDYQAVLADPAIDAVSVCTDHASHSPITVAALQAGKHVLCEKALAANAAGLDAMLAAHARHGPLVFSGVFQHRFDRAMQTLKRLVDEGALGQVLTAGIQVRCYRSREYYGSDEWRGTWAREGGAVLINQSIHFIDAVAWIMGGVEAVCGTHANLTHDGVLEAEDTAVASLRFRSGALGVIEATCSSHLGWEPTVSIHGSEGSIELRSGQAMKVLFADQELTRRIESELAAGHSEQVKQVGRIHYGTGHPLHIADFVEAVRQHRPPFVTARSARHAVDIVLAIYESHRHGGWVRVESNC